MTQIRFLAKDLTSVLDIGIDWSRWLKTDTIVTSEWTAAPEVTISRLQNDATSTSCFIAGGVFGEVYRIVNKITTQDGRVDSRYISVVIEDTSV
jgi:hypothetical protein